MKQKEKLVEAAEKIMGRRPFENFKAKFVIYILTCINQ